MSRRIATLAAVYLLLGLVATWAVAWGSAAFTRFGSPTNTICTANPRDYWLLADHRAWGGRRISLVRLPDTGDVEEWLLDGPASPVPNWIAEPGPFERLIDLERRGWPFAALACGIEDHFQNPGVLEDRATDWAWTPYWHSAGRSQRAVQCSHAAAWAIALPSNGATANQTANAILFPMLPIWPGLIADTLFFGAVFAGMHQLAGLTRRRRRKRRGLCVRCGYDLSGLAGGGCPECGRPNATTETRSRLVTKAR